MSEFKNHIARAMMKVVARRPGWPDDRELPVLALDPDFDDLPLDHTEGTEDDEITQAAVLRLVDAAIEAMRLPTDAMNAAGSQEPVMHSWGNRGEFIDADGAG